MTHMCQLGQTPKPQNATKVPIQQSSTAAHSFPIWWFVLCNWTDCWTSSVVADREGSPNEHTFELRQIARAVRLHVHAERVKVLSMNIDCLFMCGKQKFACGGFCLDMALQCGPTKERLWWSLAWTTHKIFQLSSSTTFQVCSSSQCHMTHGEFWEFVSELRFILSFVQKVLTPCCACSNIPCVDSLCWPVLSTFQKLLAWMKGSSCACGSCFCLNGNMTESLFFDCTVVHNSLLELWPL